MNNSVSPGTRDPIASPAATAVLSVNSPARNVPAQRLERGDVLRACAALIVVFHHHLGILFGFLLPWRDGLRIFPENPWKAVALFVNRYTCTLGIVSFSAYITHFAALKVMQKVATRLPPISSEAQFLFLFSTSLILTAGVSWLTYRSIEQPGIALGRSLLRSLNAK